MPPDFPQRHISDLTLDNNLVASSLFPWEDGQSTETKRVQFGALMTLLAEKYFAKKDLSNIAVADVLTFITQLANPKGAADDGSGLWKRDSTNATHQGLETLAAQLINNGKLRDLGLTDKFFESLTAQDFVRLGRLLSGELIRDSSNSFDGVLLSKDAKGLTETGYQNIRNLRYFDMNASGALNVPLDALNKIVRVNMTGDITTIILPTLPNPQTDFGQVTLLIRRNGFNIANTSLSVNGYVARNNPANTLLIGSALIDQAIEIFAEFDAFTNPNNPTWVWGSSKIGH